MQSALIPTSKITPTPPDSLGKTEVIQYDTRNGKHYSYTIIKAGPKQITLFSPILKRNIKKGITHIVKFFTFY